MWADIKIALSHQQGWTTTSARRSIACPMPHNRLATLSVFDSIILAPLWQICDHSCDCIAGCRWGSNKLETSPAEQRWSADRALPWHVWDGRLEACVEVSVRQCRKHCIAMSITRSSRDLLNTAHILPLLKCKWHMLSINLTAYTCVFYTYVNSMTHIL